MGVKPHLFFNFMPRKQRKSKVPQAQSWQSKTSSSRASNKHKKVLNYQVQAANAQNFHAQQVVNGFHANMADIIHYFTSQSFWVGINAAAPVIIGTAFSPNDIFDVLRYGRADAKMGWDMGILNKDAKDVRELQATIILMYVVDCLGGKIAIPYEKVEEYYHENLYVEHSLENRHILLSTNFGKNGATRLLEGKHTPVKKLTTVDADVAVKAMLIQNGVNEKTIARVERKHFEQALLHDIVINTDEDFDDYVYIGLKKKELNSNGEPD